MTGTASSSRPSFAWRAVLLVALAAAAVHLTCLTQYGWFRDELYYLSCAKRLAWGYVDQPPFSIAALALVRATAGDSLAAFRIVAMLVSLLAAGLAAGIARELHGRAYAQGLTAFVVAFAPIGLGIGHFYSMNVFDLAFWALGTLLALRAIESEKHRDWLLLGLALGLGLLNKWSVLWLGAGIGVAMLISPRRRVLLTRWPWISVALAAVIVSPHVLWQVSHGWPTLEFMHNAATQKMAAFDLGKLLIGACLALGPGAAPIWIAGLIVSLSPKRPSWWPIATIALVTLAILTLNRTARVEYLTLAGPGLFAAGAVWWESRTRLLRIAIPTLAGLLLIPILPLALPILPVERFIAYTQAIGLAPRTEERHRMGRLPQHQADMFGWPELADSVARVAATLTPEERRTAIVVVGNYGEAGALERFGAGRIPTIACQHNNWFLWGPPHWDGAVGIFVGRDSTELATEFDHVEMVTVAGHPLAMPYERDLPIAIVRGFRGDLARAWVAGKHFE